MKQKKIYHYHPRDEILKGNLDKKAIASLINEVRRYEYIADYFQQNPERLTEKNKNYLEGILYKLYDIEGMQLPEQVKKICSKTLNSLLIKFENLI